MSRKQFKKLQDEWYQKLEDEGFEDVERKGYRNTSKIAPEPVQSEKYLTRVGAASQVRYYHWCNRVIWTYKFENDTHRFIFELHANGKSERQIEAALSKQDVHPKYGKTHINRIINSIKDGSKSSI